MKRITLLALLAFSAVSFAQIKKADTTTEAASSGEVIGKITQMGSGTDMECIKNGPVYVFTYKDYQYRTMDQYASFAFEDVDNAFENFYKMTIDLFETKPEEPVKIETRDAIVWISYKRTMGIATVSFKSSAKTAGAPVSFTKDFNKKQIEKLFGKKK